MNFLDPRLPDRFWSKCIPEPNSGCWIWTGYLSQPFEYGHFNWLGRVTNAHRVAYEQLVGPLPVGFHIDHRVCKTPCCVNPAHLEAVTPGENTRRALVVRAVRKTHCINGHELVESNVYRKPNGHRQCLTCRRSVDQARDATPRRKQARKLRTQGEQSFAGDS